MAIIVRAAEDEDILSILKLSRQFAKSTMFGKYFSPAAVAGMIKYSIMNGCCIVAVDTKNEDKIVGTLYGSISINPWTDRVRELREIAWWVDPEYRNTRAGLKLYKRYVQESKEMIEDGTITGSFMTTLETTGESGERLVSRDFKKMESHYIMEG